MNDMSKVVERLGILFNPRSLALIGASNDPLKWGYRILKNIKLGGFEGEIYPVNHREKEILGFKAYENVSAIPQVPDLVVIVVPTSAVKTALQDCIAKGIKVGVVITAGFSEIGDEGKRLENEMLEIAAEGDFTIIGPNGNGVMSPPAHLCSVMTPLAPPAGHIAVIGQSGNLAASITRQIVSLGFGCSRYVSTGNESQLRFEDYLQYLGQDDQTKVILGYIEGTKDGTRLLEVARKVNKSKPMVIIKGGETMAGARAAKSHTASLAGSDLVFQAACRQAGIIKLNDLKELVNTGVAFLCQPLPKGNRVGIISEGGGWGVLSADLSAKAGLEVSQLPEKTVSQLAEILPAWWTRSNPIDLVAGARGRTVIRALEILLESPAVDGAIILGVAPMIPTIRDLAKHDSEAVSSMAAEIADIFAEYKELSRVYQKPIIGCAELAAISHDLDNKVAQMVGQKGFMYLNSPQQAASIFANLGRYSRFLEESA